MNLQKASLRAVPVAGDPSKLAIIFSFDASAPCKWVQQHSCRRTSCCKGPSDTAYCRVTVFIMATEDAAHGCQLTTATKQAPAPGIIYQQGVRAAPGCSFGRLAQDCEASRALPSWWNRQAGPSKASCLTSSCLQLGLMFPKADGVSVLLDVSQYEREALLTPGADTYPLAVRMETITPKGEAEGRTLQVSQPRQQPA